MVDLLTFFRGTLGHRVPREAEGWLRGYVEPDEAIERAHAVHLMWLSSLCEEQTSQEIVAVCFGRIEARQMYAEAQREPQDSAAAAALALAARRLREALQGTRWWAALVERWEARQTRGLGVARYSLARVDVEPVRGTRVGRFAVRELRWDEARPVMLPALRYREETPRCRRHEAGPERLYAVDLVEDGRSLGSFASAAVAFEVAARFDRRGLIEPPVPRALQRVLDEYRGRPPRVHARSWPAEPHWSFAECRRRMLGWGDGDRRDRDDGRGHPVRVEQLGERVHGGDAGRVEADCRRGEEVGHAR
ncbi:hypothetical protein [Paraliomyxa miuraensis]|uniref:hypothetical protein n=1 Tax=Paraliomyxa miuraensis TaxID=376150 RepID=UPI002258BE0E|nr:hypothetical protein [Paraliomyxa miuraensis]MCX4244232.1 hypothetical protein [Paraliomyxa miuraensis]